MKHLILIAIGTLVASTTHAEELCSEWERKIAPDMQIQESDFTLESYDEALERLYALGREPRTELTWMAEGNALNFVEGWLLKRRAVESLSANPDTEKTTAVKRFCEWLVNKAFYYD